MSDIFNDVKQVVVEQLGVERDKVEEKFDIEIPDEEAEKIKTVGDAVAYIESHK